jgi:ppGpp synthetase/RelA/SpoT-type nucleotidyltranferase
VAKDSREEGDRYGYRAVHIVVAVGGRLAEIQVRTQDAWAQMIEKMDEFVGSDLKHGQGPPEQVAWFKALSDALREADLGESVELPASPWLPSSGEP